MQWDGKRAIRDAGPPPWIILSQAASDQLVTANLAPPKTNKADKQEKGLWHQEQLWETTRRRKENERLWFLWGCAWSCQAYCQNELLLQVNWMMCEQRLIPKLLQIRAQLVGVRISRPLHIPVRKCCQPGQLLQTSTKVKPKDFLFVETLVFGLGSYQWCG